MDKIEKHDYDCAKCKHKCVEGLEKLRNLRNQNNGNKLGHYEWRLIKVPGHGYVTVLEWVVNK